MNGYIKLENEGSYGVGDIIKLGHALRSLRFDRNLFVGMPYKRPMRAGKGREKGCGELSRLHRCWWGASSCPLAGNPAGQNGELQVALIHDPSEGKRPRELKRLFGESVN